MRVNFNRYLSEMERLGYSNNFEILDAREFGLPQARERVFTVSVLGNEKFSFDDLIKTPMRNISDFLLSDAPPVYAQYIFHVFPDNVLWFPFPHLLYDVNGFPHKA